MPIAVPPCLLSCPAPAGKSPRKPAPPHSRSIEMITESPESMKNHSELVFPWLPRRMLPPAAPLSGRFCQGNGLVNVLPYPRAFTTRACLSWYGFPAIYTAVPILPRHLVFDYNMIRKFVKGKWALIPGSAPVPLLNTLILPRPGHITARPAQNHTNIYYPSILPRRRGM